MGYVHVAHDCQIGNKTIMANYTGLAGHVRVGDWAILGGATVVHQFVHIGAHSFTSMGTYLDAGPAALRHGGRQHGQALRHQQRGAAPPRLLGGRHRAHQAGLPHAVPLGTRARGSQARARGAGRGLRRKSARCSSSSSAPSAASSASAVSEAATRVAMVAGEASGDQLGAHLIAALKARRPGLRFAGIGGPRMAAQGFDVARVRWTSSRCAAMPRRCGTTGASRASAAQLGDALLAERPGLFIGVDASDFNLDLERRLKEAGIPAVHYVSPSVWAWRGWRVQRVARSATHLLAMFPFEPALYEQHRAAGHLRRPSAGRRDSAGGEQGRGARAAAPAGAQAHRRAAAGQPALGTAVHGRRLRARGAPPAAGHSRSAFRLPDGVARDARPVRGDGARARGAPISR